MNVTLLVLTLNEIDGMKIIMPQVDHKLFTQIIVADGGSTDGTIEWAKEQGYEVVVQKNPGLRNGYIEALPSIKGDVILTFSPDGNCRTQDLPLIIEEMKHGHDLVIASRYLRHAKSEDDDIITKFGNWLFTTIVNVLYGAKYTDVMTIYRAFKTELVYDLKLTDDSAYEYLERMYFTKICWGPLMSVRAARAKKSISEVPAPEPARIAGVRKLQIVRWGLAYLTQFFVERFTWERKPSNELS